MSWGGKDRAPIFTWHVNLRDRDTHDLHDSEGSVCECEQPYSDYRDGQISPAMAAQREPYLPVLYPRRRERDRERERERQREREREREKETERERQRERKRQRERSTWTKPESWCSRRRPGLREADTSSVTEEKSWSTAPATLTWHPDLCIGGASVWL